MRTSLFKMLDKLNCCYKQTTPLCLYLWDMYYGPVALYYEIKLCYVIMNELLFEQRKSWPDFEDAHVTQGFLLFVLLCEASLSKTCPWLFVITSEAIYTYLSII